MDRDELKVKVLDYLEKLVDRVGKADEQAIEFWTLAVGAVASSLLARRSVRRALAATGIPEGDARLIARGLSSVTYLGVSGFYSARRVAQKLHAATDAREARQKQERRAGRAKEKVGGNGGHPLS